MKCFGMLFLALFLLRIYLFFGGNKWEGWRQYIPLRKDHFKEMWEVMKFYASSGPRPVSKIGHNHMAALSYVGIYVTDPGGDRHRPGDVSAAAHNAFLLALVGWIPRFVNVQTLR